MRVTVTGGTASPGLPEWEHRMVSGQLRINECITLTRAYLPAAGGHRVLVDRLWPRGLSKRDARLDEWLKDVGPTTELRKWYGHVPEKFSKFKGRYQDELNRPPAQQAVEHILDMASTERVVLLTATRDVEHSAAQVLLDHLQDALTRRWHDEVDEMVDGWSRDSFPASDPPGCLPPTLAAE